MKFAVLFNSLGLAVLLSQPVFAEEPAKPSENKSASSETRAPAKDEADKAKEALEKSEWESERDARDSEISDREQRRAADLESNSGRAYSEKLARERSNMRSYAPKSGDKSSNNIRTNR